MLIAVFYEKSSRKGEINIILVILFEKFEVVGLYNKQNCIFN